VLLEVLAGGSETSPYTGSFLLSFLRPHGITGASPVEKLAVILHNDKEVSKELTIQSVYFQAFAERSITQPLFLFNSQRARLYIT
jgi:hypothetical protein